MLPLPVTLVAFRGKTQGSPDWPGRQSHTVPDVARTERAEAPAGAGTADEPAKMSKVTVLAASNAPANAPGSAAVPFRFG